MEELKLHQFAEKLELLGYSKRVIADYPAYLRLFFLYLEENENIRTAEEIKSEHVTAYHAHLQYTKRTDGCYLSTATVRARLQVVKTFFSVMHQEGAVSQDIAGLIKLPRTKQPLPKHVPTEQDMKRLLDSITPTDPITTRDRALLEVLYATALRSEEVRSLKVDSLDITERTLLVAGKGSRDRVVPVGGWVMPYLLEYLEAARPKLLNPRDPLPLLFLSKNGRKITSANLGDLTRKYCERAGTQSSITPHSFRHACATHLLRAGADIRYVQELLGHAQLSTTQIYTKIDISFLKKAHSKYHPRERADDAE